MPELDATAPESQATAPDGQEMLHLRPPVDVMAVLPLIIDALDVTIESLYFHRLAE